MSVYAQIRQVADAQFPDEVRSKGIAFAIGLALGVHYANNTQVTENVENAYIQYAMQGVKDATSTVAENVLMDTRYCIELSRQVFKMILAVKSRPVSINPRAKGLLGILFDGDGYLTEDEESFFEQHKAGIMAIHHIVLSGLINDGE